MINKMMAIRLVYVHLQFTTQGDCEKFKVDEKLAEINCVHYLKHNRKRFVSRKHILITFSFLILSLLEQSLLLSQHVTACY